MRFMLLQNYGPVESDCPPMPEWSPADIKAHIDFQHALNSELLERGELVDAQGLAGPEQARRVVSDGTGAPVITDGPFPEAKELLAGYRLVDVDYRLAAGHRDRRAGLRRARPGRDADPPAHRGPAGTQRARPGAVSMTQTGERAWAVRPGRAVGAGFPGSREHWMALGPGG